MKTAVILFNLGGPDGPEAVKPFLFNLFRDRAIIGLPNPLRWLVAKLISARRAPVAQHIYAQIGGGSPILALTRAQAEKLEERLNRHASAGWHAGEYKAFVCMRYWHPMSDRVAEQVKAWNAERVILLPLYPQYSTTTTGSSIAEWRRAAKETGLDAPTKAICCYPGHPYFIASHAAQLLKTYEEAKLKGVPRILFSAHGLPEKVIARGDPYQWQVEETVRHIVAAAFGGQRPEIKGGESEICRKHGQRSEATTGEPDTLGSSDVSTRATGGIRAQAPACFTRHAIMPTEVGGHRDTERLGAESIDYRICYQSRVGPMKWIGPSTEEEILRAAEEGTPLVIVPVAFVSEHSETLVELDIEYRALAAKQGLGDYFRVPALGIDDWFIDALADMVGQTALANGSQEEYPVIRSYCGARICPRDFTKCAMG